MFANFSAEDSVINHSEGLRPSDSLTRSLAGRHFSLETAAVQTDGATLTKRRTAVALERL
jgi:hypothetical protein